MKRQPKTDISDEGSKFEKKIFNATNIYTKLQELKKKKYLKKIRRTIFHLIQSIQLLVTRTATLPQYFMYYYAKIFISISYLYSVFLAPVAATYLPTSIP